MTTAPTLLTPRDPAWHAARQAGVGSSESPALFGFGFKSQCPLSIYLSKVTPPKALAADEGDTAMRRGSKMEAWLAAEVADRKGWRIERVPTQRDAKGDPLVSSVDYVILGDDGVPWAILECKTAAFRAMEWADPGVVPDGAPPRVLVQVQHQMEVGLDWQGVRIFPRVAFVGACVTHLDDVRVYEVQRHEGVGAAIRAKCVAFWRDHIAPRIPPEFDGSDAGDKLLRMLYPADTRPTLIKADAAADAALAALHVARTAYDVADAAKAKAEQVVKDLIGEHAGIEGAAGRVTWKANKSTAKIDTEAVAGDLLRALGEACGVPRAQAIAAESKKKNEFVHAGARVLRCTFAGD